jgi:hypothetical protein
MTTDVVLAIPIPAQMTGFSKFPPPLDAAVV